MSSNVLKKLNNDEKNPYVNIDRSKTQFADIDFTQYFDNKTRPISFRTMVPMCLWVNKIDKLSRINFPYLDRKDGTASCSLDNKPQAWQINMSSDEKGRWKLYNYWVFNVFNLPPRPAGMQIFQATNKKEPPWNLIGLGEAGIFGNSKSIINDAIIWESGIFKILDQSDDSIWRFMTYTKPIPNTKMLYIYDTNLWNVPPTNNKIQDPKNILESKTASHGKATPVGLNQPSQLYITPDPEKDLQLSRFGASYIWVCEKEYTQFICPKSIIIPYTSDLYKQFPQSPGELLKPIGYWTAMKQSTRNMQNWIKYKDGSSDGYRHQLLSLNYKEELETNKNTILIIITLIILVILIITIFYLFKK